MLLKSLCPLSPNPDFGRIAPNGCTVRGFGRVVGDLSPGDSHGIPFHPDNDDLVSEPCPVFLMGQISMVRTVPCFFFLLFFILLMMLWAMDGF